MAVKNGNKAKKKTSGTTKQPQKKTTKKQQSSQKPLTSLILFAVSVFILAVTFIPGQNLWKLLRDFFFGLFGFAAYVFPFYLIALAVFYALDKLKGMAIVRFIEIAALTLITESCIDLFAIARPAPEVAYTLGDHLAAAYNSGIALKSGGFFGGLIAQPLYSAFGKAGAIITICIILFVLIMVITGTTLVALIRKMQSSAENVKESYKEFRDNIEEQRRRRREEIDIPLDESNVEDLTKDMNDKQKKVISTYKDIDIPEPEEEFIPEEESEEIVSVTIPEALEAAEEEVFPVEEIEKENNFTFAPLQK